MSEAKPLIEVDEALALWDWAWEELEMERESVPHGFTREGFATSMLDVLTFLACELALAGRHEWVERLPEMLRMYEGWLMREDSPLHKSIDALGALIAQGAPVGKSVQAMARSGDAYLRAVLARTLRVEDPEARPLLEQLASDGDRHVRKIARRRLPAQQPSAWWEGVFDSDPVPRIPELDDELLAALRTVALFANRETNKQQAAMLPEFAEALPRLPTPILVEVARRFVAFDYLAPGYVAMLDELLKRPGGAEALYDMLASRLGKPHSQHQLALILSALGKELDEANREPLCRGLLQTLVDRRDRRRARAMAGAIERVVVEQWPASLPGALALDAWETLASDSPKIAETMLPLLHAKGVDLRSEIGRLLPLAEAHKELVNVLSRAVRGLDPEPRRAFVVRGFASEAEAVRALALEQLASLPPDPAQRSAAELFAGYWAEPSLRRTIRKNSALAEVFCPYLRRQLRAGALELKEATATLLAVGRLWGGTAGSTSEDERAAKLEHAAAWHAGAAETGPPTEQEWARLRALQRQELDDEGSSVHASSLLAARPPGPLRDEDRELVDWLMNSWRQSWAAAEAPDAPEERPGGPLFNQTLTLHFGLCSIVDPYALTCAEEVLAKIDSLGGDAPLLDMFREQVEGLRQRLAAREG